MRVAYEHCKEKSDEVLSDIARQCYEDTAEAAGVSQLAQQCQAHEGAR